MALRYNLSIKIPKNLCKSLACSTIAVHKNRYNELVKIGTPFTVPQHLWDRFRDQACFRQYSLISVNNCLSSVKLPRVGDSEVLCIFEAFRPLADIYCAQSATEFIVTD